MRRSSQAAPKRRDYRLGASTWQRSIAGVWRKVPRFVPWTVAGLVLAIIVTMVVDAVVYSGKIHAGVTVAGYDVSGLDREAATARLAEQLEAAQDRSLTLVYKDQTWEVSPESIGLEVDLDATVSAALGATRDADLITDQAQKLTLYFSVRDIPFAGTADAAKLEAVLDRVGAAIDSPAVNASVTIQAGAVEAVVAREGVTVDRAALGEQILQSLCGLESYQLNVPVTVDQPEIRADDCADAVAAIQTMTSGPLTLTSLDQSWTFSPAQVAHFIDLSTEIVDGVPTLTPYISADRLAPTFKVISAQMSPTPVDARFDADDTGAWVVPSVPGRTLRPDETVQAINEAVLATDDREVEITVDIREPKFTTEEAEAMGIKDLLSERTTAFTGTRNRQNNVRVATAAINKDDTNFLAPGDEFSFLEAVGDRTPEQGYKEAFGIQANGSLEGELGGGICQVATTVFNAVFFAGLEVTERRNHTMYISHYPQGRDAAVTTDPAGTVDLRFVNDTDNYIWIRGESDGVTTTFRIYGTSDGREVTFRNSGKYNVGPAPPVWKSVDNSLQPGQTVVVSPGQPRLQVKVTRWTTWPDSTVKEDVFLSKYPERPRIVHVGPGT